MTRRWIVAGLVSILSAASVHGAMANERTTFTTMDVIAGSTNLDCLNYCIVGVCYHLVCTLFGCHIETSVRIRHHLPDFVVTSYNTPGASPWLEGRAAFGTLGRQAAASILGALTNIPVGGGPIATGQRSHKLPVPLRHRRAVRFKETDVIGNPALAALSRLPQELGGGLLCPSDTEPMAPYFLSGLDAFEWRWGLVDTLHPAAWLPGLREIGNWPANTWGQVYPRTGFVLAIEDPKAGAVAAQRAVDIVTRTGQPHVYLPADGPQSNEQTDRWLMIHPKRARSCETFGTNADNWSGGKVSQDGGYGFLYWRQYSCCTGKVGVLIGWTPTPPVCISG